MSEATAQAQEQVTEWGYVTNKNYGKGLYRRRVQLTASDKVVVAKLEDTFHGFIVTLKHDGNLVTEIDAEYKRTPYNTCSSATYALQPLLGAKIEDKSRDLARLTKPSANCTHVLDLAILSICHAARVKAGGNALITYDISVHDEVDGVQDIYIIRDGKMIHRWKVSTFALTEPEELKGNTLFKGFTTWAAAAFTGIDQEAAFMLQKGYFVAFPRRYEVDVAGRPATADELMRGSCHSYSEPAVNEAFRIPNTVRDFSDRPAQLLKFI